MTSERPPALARWILERVTGRNDALVGDVLEEYGRTRSRSWYWQQVMSAVLVRIPRPVTVAMVIVGLYLGSYISIPGATDVVRSLMERPAKGPGPYVLFSVFLGGGQMTWGSIFTLGINPYVSAAFIVQVVYLLWRMWYRNVERRPRLPLVFMTWSVALVLCMTQAVGFATFLERASLAGPAPFVTNPGWTFRITALLLLTAGTVCLMLISDQISKHRVGNGMFIVFIAGLLAALPGILRPLLSGALDPFGLSTVLTVNTAIAALVSFGYQRAIEKELTTT